MKRILTFILCILAAVGMHGILNFVFSITSMWIAVPVVAIWLVILTPWSIILPKREE